MARVRHRVGIRGEIEDIHRRLFHPEELSAWWATRASGQAGSGERLDLTFAELATLSFTIGALQAPKTLRLDCVAGPGSWNGSTLLFELQEEQGQVFVTLTHENEAASEDEFLYFSTKWPVYLLSLRDLVETGAGRPYPNDIKIHHGD